MSRNFTHFKETWFDHLNQLVNQLYSAPKPPTTANDQTIRDLVHKVMSHYAEYYRVKSLTTEEDPLFVFAAPWATTLERSLHWIAGWRPTTAFHLVYSESSILFESRILDIIRGHHTGDLGDLSPAQLRRVSELQCETVKEENKITNELSKWQDHACELLGERSHSDIKERIGRLVSIMKKADHLRLATISNVLELLTPQQAVQFLTAAAELQFGIRGWGINKDLQRGDVV